LRQGQAAMACRVCSAVTSSVVAPSALSRSVPMRLRRLPPAATDVARAVVYMASLPLEANVQFVTVMATKMPFVGRG